MKIVKTYPENLNKRDAYRLVKAASAKKLIDAAGSVLEPDAWVLYEDEEKTVLTIEADSEIFGTISETFIKEFMDAFNELGSDMGPIKVIQGQTKNGRSYITCELA